MIVWLVIFPGQPVDGALAAVVDADGEARGHGLVHIQDGTSNTVFTADGPAQAACRDADGDGSAGLTQLTFGLREVRSGARLTAVVTPVGGDIEHAGRVKVKFPSLQDDGDPLEVGAWVRIATPRGVARALDAGNTATSTVATASQ